MQVMVSGCFDMLHSGHVAFLEAAARLGELHVAIGSDRTIGRLKGKCPENGEQERLYLVRSLRCVTDAFVSQGSGVLDFEQEFVALRPDSLVVNEDGHHPQKEDLCGRHGVRYVIEKRVPATGLPDRSTTQLRATCRLPYRIDLAGGWLDQPFVSRYAPGPVVVASIEPDHDFDRRSGMATSTRDTAAGLWGSRLPAGNPTQLAKTLFACENPPGTEVISGSQDALGIVLPGINRLHYSGKYWPAEIGSIRDDETAVWLESIIYLKQTASRAAGFDVLAETHITSDRARRLSEAAEDCWGAIRRRDSAALGDAVRRSFEAQISMFPLMSNRNIEQMIADLPSDILGYKLTGAGGGGYLLCVSRQELEGWQRVKIRRSDF